MSWEFETISDPTLQHWSRVRCGKWRGRDCFVQKILLSSPLPGTTDGRSGKLSVSIIDSGSSCPTSRWVKAEIQTADETLTPIIGGFLYSWAWKCQPKESFVDAALRIGCMVLAVLKAEPEKSNQYSDAWMRGHFTIRQDTLVWTSWNGEKSPKEWVSLEDIKRRQLGLL